MYVDLLNDRFIIQAANHRFSLFRPIDHENLILAAFAYCVSMQFDLLWLPRYSHTLGYSEMMIPVVRNGKAIFQSRVQTESSSAG